ncbi:hypothetical protein KKH39_00105 [Patescibacteria group bacterium]|nr:hypothetical protein [Patescibacteria group bacterium]
MEEAPKEDKTSSVFERLSGQRPFRLLPIVDFSGGDETNPVYHYGQELLVTILYIETNDMGIVEILFSFDYKDHPRIKPGQYELVFDEHGNCWNPDTAMFKPRQKSA